jgi:hypothetical protein
MMLSDALSSRIHAIATPARVLAGTSARRHMRTSGLKSRIEVVASLTVNVLLTEYTYARGGGSTGPWGTGSRQQDMDAKQSSDAGIQSAQPIIAITLDEGDSSTHESRCPPPWLSVLHRRSEARLND